MVVVPGYFAVPLHLVEIHFVELTLLKIFASSFEVDLKMSALVASDSDKEPLTANEYRSGYSSGNDEYHSHDNKIKQVQDELDNAKEAVRQSLVKVVERGDRLESISATAENLQIEAGMFKKNARRTHMQLNIVLASKYIIVHVLYIVFAFNNGK